MLDSLTDAAGDTWRAGDRVETWKEMNLRTEGGEHHWWSATYGVVAAVFPEIVVVDFQKEKRCHEAFVLSPNYGHPRRDGVRLFHRGVGKAIYRQQEDSTL